MSRCSKIILVIENSPLTKEFTYRLSGAGISALRLLNRPGSKLSDHQELERAVYETCYAARNKGVKILLDAEQQSMQGCVDTWSMVSEFQQPVV